MPRKKSRLTRIKRKPIRKEKSWKWTDSYSSFLLGVVVVIVGVLFIGTFLRNQKAPVIKDTSSLQTGPTATFTPSPTPGETFSDNGQTYYNVKPGDYLSQIAKRFYKDETAWTKIAKANNLTNPDLIFSGNKLLLPNLPSASALGQLVKPSNPELGNEAIVGSTYTVEKDDTLWEIALRAYGDNYQWKIGRAHV